MRKRIPQDWSDLSRYEGVLVEEIGRLERLLDDVADAAEGPRQVMADKYREMIQNRRELLNMIRAKAVEAAVGEVEGAVA
ncbi:MAG TPA: hypothetical protein VFM46_14835 [Pseudomonadales bacterium]|nr:hypothetical protein [Pseudomonadales bacterium]